MNIRLLRHLAFIMVLGTAAAWAQTEGNSNNEQALEKRVAELANQLSQQQAQIQMMQQTQMDLLRELQAARAAKSANAPPSGPDAQAAPGASAADSQPATAADASKPVAETPSNLRAGKYIDWRQGGDTSTMLGDRVRLGGYGSFRFETNDVASGNNIPGGSAAGFTFRRFVLTTDARPASRLRIYSEIEFERLHSIEVEKNATFNGSKLKFKQAAEGRGELSIEQAWGQYNFSENHGLRAGVVLVPVGRFNLLHDDDYWDIARRTLVDRDGPVIPVKSAWRDLGAGLVGNFNVGSKGKIDYQLYALNGAALDFNIEQEAEFENGSPGEAAAVLESDLKLSSGFFDGAKSATALAGRVAYSPTLNGEMAFSGYHGKYAPSFLSFREPVTTLAYDHKWRWKGFETEGEFAYTTMGNLNRVLDNFALTVVNSANEQVPTSGGGGLTKVEVESELSNLARTKYGFWSDFKYHARPKWLRNSFLGRGFEDPQIIPVFRYERIWLNDATSEVEVSGGLVTGAERQNLEQDRFTAGISYRPTLQFVMQAAYEHNRKLSGDRLVFPKVNAESTNGLILGMSFAF